MKKVIILLIALSFALSATSQEHLSFKGIPITGSITSFCQKLRAKGFTQTHSSENARLFSGKFTGKTATIGVGASDNGKDVFTVCVFFDSTGEWNNLTSTYYYYKELYTQKYGEPSACVENNPSRSTNNTSLMLALDNSDFAYGCIFETTGGSIEISIRKGQLTCQGFVLIRYEDNINTQAKRQSDLDDI